MSDRASVSVLLLGIFAIMLIGLKLTESIAWSWWWVLSPLWIPLALALLLAVIGLLINAAAERRR